MTRPSARWLWQAVMLRTAVLLVVCGTSHFARPTAQSGEAAGEDGKLAAIESRIRKRVADRPNDASAWRMLGRLRLDRDDHTGAYVAFAMAVKLDGLSAAAHFDLGRVLVQFERHREAAEHFKQAVALAPESEYATEARQGLEQIATLLGDDSIQQVDYEVTRFTGIDVPEEKAWQEPPPPKRFYAHIETGVLYNSNVALSPIDRELSAASRDSVQGFVAPEFEFYALDNGTWRAGPAMVGYFNLNEGPLREFNLQSYQPGAFVERTVCTDFATLVPRVQYDFIHDEFDGQTFGNRHALTTSSLAHWPGGHKSFLYWTIDFTDILSDGSVPSITSRDGWTNTIGLSHKFPIERRHLRSFRAGVDWQHADLDGSDFRYDGVTLFGELDVPITDDLWFLLQGGWGFRDYFDFTSSPSRDETIWQAGVELRRRIAEHLIAAAVFNYDRFDSDNALFEAERFLSGVVLTFEY